ncbi:MAG: bifunctional riboflavin kinase/FAD synthetase [Betaproteobacteria bacterium]|nr:bifunctional riboflavin kinase/FAD synthetase [Betaproteobacteria bacterium]
MRITHGVPRFESPTAVTIGNFDGIHQGHQAMLRRVGAVAREQGLQSCVLTFEPHPREFFAPEKAPSRLTSLREKLELFACLGLERAHICRFDTGLARQAPDAFVSEILVQGLRARWVLVGDDFRFGAGRAGDLHLLQAMGRRLHFDVAAMHSVLVGGRRASSTLVREALAKGDIEGARELLGRPYSISGRVVDGDKLGKRLGFPTANIQLKHNRPPLAGIFAVTLHGLPEGMRRGVASLGLRPTVKANGRPTLEVHLFDFAREIYGTHVRVDFLHKLRDEAKFPSLDALVAQIERDCADGREYFASAVSVAG